MSSAQQVGSFEQIRWQATSRTHVGHVRRVNEDSVLCQTARELWVVADGMGGHRAGDHASQSIVNALSELTLAGDFAARVDQVEDTLLGVNDHLREYARAQCGGQTVGSTVAVMVACEEVGVVLWAGDSRLYRRRDGSLEQITRDHNPIADLFESGAVTEEEVLAADTNVVTRAVGGQGELHLDIVVFEIKPGDAYLLCTDGLYREVTSGDMHEGMALDAESGADLLMRRALTGPANDNVSLVAISTGQHAT